MYKTFLSILFFVSIFSISCNSILPDKEKSRIDAVCDQYMQDFRDNKIVEGMQLLHQNSILPSATLDTLQKTILIQINRFFPAYGKPLAVEFISEKKIKDFITKRYYILKYENFFLKFDFTLYNNGNHWTITGFNYNDDLSGLIQ